MKIYAWGRILNKGHQGSIQARQLKSGKVEKCYNDEYYNDDDYRDSNEIGTGQ